MDPIINLLMNKDVIDVSSTLIAKLERIRYDETRRGVFRTRWADDIFKSAVSRMGVASLKNFDIDLWFASVVSDHPSDKKRYQYQFGPSIASQSIETNWLLPLLKLEIEAPGFIQLFHNAVMLEDSTHRKMAEDSKRDDHYDFIGVGMQNKALQATTTVKSITNKQQQQQRLK
jgi:hypothetical protein